MLWNWMKNYRKPWIWWVADLPCSGLGITGEEAGYQKQGKTRRSGFPWQELQREILSVVWQYVKPGGMLVYSTCTIDKKRK